jgi:hypothetical protein
MVLCFPCREKANAEMSAASSKKFNTRQFLTDLLRLRRPPKKETATVHRDREGSSRRGTRAQEVN